MQTAHDSRVSPQDPGHSPLPSAPPARDSCGPFRHLFAGVLLALTLSLPSGVQAGEHLDAALAVVVPPEKADIEQIVDLLAASHGTTKRSELRSRLERLYRSKEFRHRAAAVYAGHLSQEELEYLAETFEHPVFRKYRRIVPRLMLELAEVERDLFSRSDQ